MAQLLSRLRLTNGVYVLSIDFNILIRIEVTKIVKLRYTLKRCYLLTTQEHKTG
jgi:hypothetical protein